MSDALKVFVLIHGELALPLTVLAIGSTEEELENKVNDAYQSYVDSVESSEDETEPLRSRTEFLEGTQYVTMFIEPIEVADEENG